MGMVVVLLVFSSSCGCPGGGGVSTHPPHSTHTHTYTLDTCVCPAKPLPRPNTPFFSHEKQSKPHPKGTTPVVHILCLLVPTAKERKGHTHKKALLEKGSHRLFLAHRDLIMHTPQPTHPPHHPPPTNTTQQHMDTTDAPQLIPHTQKALAYTPHDVKWVPASARLVSVGATGGGKGTVEVLALQGGELVKQGGIGRCGCRWVGWVGGLGGSVQ